MTLTIEQVQTDAYATACAKGWHVRPLVLLVNPLTIDHDRVLAKLALVHTELTEAQDCLDDRELIMTIGDAGTLEGFVVEIADVCIRLGDLCGALSEGDATLFQLRCVDLGGWSTVAQINDRSAPELNRWMLRIRKQIDLATEAARVNDWTSFTDRLSVAVDCMASICAGVGVNLPEAIAAKMLYNSTRSHRHGGKSA
jgi:hypothetical protein